MTLSKNEAEAIRAIVGLPEDDWQPGDWATFSVARDLLADHLARYDRSVQRRGKPVGAKRRASDEEWERNRPLAIERSGGFCEVNASRYCKTYGSHVHHKAGRVGPGAHDLGNLLVACQACHNYIHANPEVAYREGWMLKRLGAA